MPESLNYYPEDDSKYFADTHVEIGERKFNIKICTLSGGEKPNEDAFAVSVHSNKLFAGVFDGTTSLRPVTALKDQTGAHFASHFLRNNFDSVTRSCIDPKEILPVLNHRLMEASEKLDPNLKNIHALPATTATIVSLDTAANELSLAHTGDSFCVVYYKDGASKKITDDTNREFDEIVFKLIRQRARLRNVSPKEARNDNEIKAALLAKSTRINSPSKNGYGLINGDPNMQLYMQIMSVPLDNISSLLLGSDGLVPVNFDIDNAESRSLMRQDIQSGGLEKLVARVHKSQDDDPDWNYTRFKERDDATGLYISLD